jgi:t-SNARE complex subunit (syntaxin)
MRVRGRGGRRQAGRPGDDMKLHLSLTLEEIAETLGRDRKTVSRRIAEAHGVIGRMLGGDRAGRWIRRGILGVAWVIIAVIVVFGMVIPLVKRILS